MDSRAFDNLSGNGRTADQFRNDIYFGICDDFAPVRSTCTAGKFNREILRCHRTAANCRDTQPETEFQRDLIGIGGQNMEGARAHISEPDHTNSYIVHSYVGYDTEMGDLASHFRARRALLALVPAALAARLLPAQSTPPVTPNDQPEDVRLPNGKRQQDEILKAEYEQNVRDARDLVSLSKSFEEDLEKDDRFVLSLSSLKKLDDMEKLTKRI